MKVLAILVAAAGPERAVEACHSHPEKEERQRPSEHPWGSESERREQEKDGGDGDDPGGVLGADVPLSDQGSAEDDRRSRDPAHDPADAASAWSPPSRLPRGVQVRGLRSPWLDRHGYPDEAAAPAASARRRKLDLDR